LALEVHRGGMPGQPGAQRVGESGMKSCSSGRKYFAERDNPLTMRG
jgi:hypothetical protein